MKKVIFVEFLSFVFLLFLGHLGAAAQTSSVSRVNVQIVTDEADAVLRILEKKENSQEVTEADWQSVFQSEGYIRLKKREHSLQRSFEDADFKAFALSENLVKIRRALAETLAKWKETNVFQIAERPLAYLPKNARIRAKIYPVIKPRENSFVFDIPDDPAIFLYLDPSISKEVFENKFAHELHHIGFGTACPMETTAAEIKKFAPDTQRVFNWIRAFGEGFAVLAAAGGADIHPHKFSSAAEKEHWDKDAANFNNDLKTVEKFFLELSQGKLNEEAEIQTARSFYGTQGPWYTVGWQMAVVIEKTFGREKLIKVMCDQRKLLLTYNKAAEKYNRREKKQLVIWSRELIRQIK